MYKNKLIDVDIWEIYQKHKKHKERIYSIEKNERRFIRQR